MTCPPNLDSLVEMVSMKKPSDTIICFPAIIFYRVHQFLKLERCLRSALLVYLYYFQNALLTATSTVVRENLKCYEPNKRLAAIEVLSFLLQFSLLEFRRET